MKIRPFTPADTASVIALWNACLPVDALNAEQFNRRVVCDVNFDASLFLLAEAENEAEEGTLTGFAYGAKRRAPDELSGLQPENGWLVAMGVLPDARTKGVGDALLTALEQALFARGVKTIDVGIYPCNYICPGVDVEAYADGLAFLTKRGYAARGDNCSMDINLRGYETPARYVEKKAKLLASGYTFEAYNYDDTLPILDFLRKDFPWWLNDVRGAIIAGRAEKTLIVAKTGGEIVGFVMRAFDGSEERFGPFGVSPTQQGTGLGGVLFHEMMNQLVQNRIFYTWFLWTNGRNLDIYGTWGMKIYRTYTMLQKKGA